MVSYSAIIPPASLGEAIRPLGDLSTVEFDALMEAVSGPRSFSLSKDELDTLRGRVPGLSPNLTYLLGALSFLHGHIVRIVESGISYGEAISATTDALDDDAKWGEKKSDVGIRLSAILENKENHQRFRKIQRLQSGFMPNAIGFSTFVDARPDFGEGEELALKGYLAVIQFRITTDSANPDARRLFFQMTEDALTEMKKAIERVEKKLALLKEKSPIGSHLIKI